MNFKKLLFFISFFSFSFGTSLSAQLYINEIMVQPPSSGSSAKQDNEELIEIRGVANSTIADNTYLIQVEGDSNDPGDIESSSNNAGGIIDLSGKTIGSNGTLVILTTGHPYTINSGGTTRITGVTDGNLEDPTHTFFLINTNGNSVEDDGGTSRSAPHSNHDLDENNDGIIDTKFTSAWTFMDGISIIDNDDSNEYGYAEVIFSKNPSNSTIYKSGTATLVDTSGQQFRYFARIGNSTGYNAGEVADADWVGGTINSGDNPNLSSSDYWHFGSNNSGIRALPEAWEGYELNHLGEPNPSSTSSTQLGTTTSTIASDTYTENSLVSGAGSGTGFGNWQIISAVSGYSGYYSSGGTAIGNSYGLWSKEFNTSKVRRLFNENLKKGDTFSITVGQTWNNGTVGVNLIDINGNEVVSLRLQSGGQWQLNNGGDWFNTGQIQVDNTEMTYSFTYDANVSSNTYSYTFHTGGSGSNHNATNDISTIRGYEVYSYNQGNGANFGFENVSIVSKFTIDGNQTIDCSDSQYIPFLTIKSGSTLNIKKGGSVKVNGAFENAGIVNITSDSNEYGSLILEGSTSGNITYNRYVHDKTVGEWDLVGSPVGSQSISGFVTTNNGSLATNSDQYAVGTYSNASGGGWSNYTTSSGSNDVANAGNFPAGTGYQMASEGGGTLTFTGTVATSDQTVAITDNSGSGGTKWNLVANPFPSYLNGNSNAGTNNFFSTNSGVLHGSFSAIYGWGGSAGYTAYNNTSNAKFIAPGQAFFVASANASGSSVAFNENMQNASPSSYDDFVANTVQDEVEIGLYNGDSRLDYTKLFFIPGLTLGLDKGYDAGHFNQSAPMMTRLSEGDEGYGMVYNAMGQQHLSQEVTIPLEINQSAGTNFTVRLESSTADDLKIYLQDTFKNTLTLLNESAFTLTAENDLSDVGRFNLITTPVTLSVDDITNNNQIRIYKSQGANYITVDGLSNTNGDVDFKLYNITGALVMSKTLDSKENRQHISSENLINGVYFAVLNNGTLASSKLFIK